MDKYNLLQINRWWDNKNFRFDTISRANYTEILIKRPSKFIDILIGARRVGKTHILYSIINHLLDSNIPSRHILYLTGELRDVEFIRIIDLIEEFRKKFNIKQDEKIFILIDEIQEIKEWQNDVKFLYDNFNIKFYLTGSSSLILNSQTSKLTGRFLYHRILPLNFQEYLNFKKIKLMKNPSVNTKIIEEYFQKGGYPENVLYNNDNYLMQIVESTIYRDLLSIYGIRNPAFLKDLLYYLSDKVTTPVSVKTIEKDLKVNEGTAKFYLKYLQDVYLIYPVYRYGNANKITKSSNPKYYFNDTGILNTLSMNKKVGLLSENTVFLKLLWQSLSRETYDIYYYLSKEFQEVDFIDNNKNLYEVKYKNILNEEDVSPYNNINISDEKIQFIVTEKTQIHAINTHNIIPINLVQFLLQ